MMAWIGSARFGLDPRGEQDPNSSPRKTASSKNAVGDRVEDRARVRDDRWQPDGVVAVSGRCPARSPSRSRRRRGRASPRSRRLPRPRNRSVEGFGMDPETAKSAADAQRVPGEPPHERMSEVPAGADIFRVCVCRHLPVAPATGGDLFPVASMWSAMVLAMMLPSAAPDDLHLRRDRRHRRAQGRAHRVAVGAGGGLPRSGSASLPSPTLAAIAFTRAAWLDGAMASASALFAGALFLAAGLYQFSALKHACLTQCQRPFPFFFANWQTTAARRVPARRAAGPLLPRLLLGDDAADVRGRRDERGLDGGARHRHDDREDRPGDASVMPSASC